MQKIGTSIVIGTIAAATIGFGLPAGLVISGSVGTSYCIYSHITRRPIISGSASSPAAESLETLNAEASFSRFAEMVFNENPEAISFLTTTPGLRSLKEVVDIYFSSKDKNYYHNDFLLAIYVMLGIKPALALEHILIRNDLIKKRTDIFSTLKQVCSLSAIKNLLYHKKLIKERIEFMSILKKLCLLNRNCRVIESSDPYEHCYFVNEAPRPIFDPRRYINRNLWIFGNGNISESVKHNFYLVIQHAFHRFPPVLSMQYNQMVAYLLGFGPTWEAFTRRLSLPNQLMEFENYQDRWIFSEEHYDQLGVALQANREIGREYSLNFWKKSSRKLDTNDQEMMAMLGLYFIADKISLKTPYLKELILRCYRVKQFLSAYSGEAIPENLRTWVFEHVFIQSGRDLFADLPNDLDQTFDTIVDFFAAIHPAEGKAQRRTSDGAIDAHLQ